MMTLVRSVEWSDLATLTQLDIQLFANDAWSESTWWAELAGRPRRRYVVAIQADSIVGYAGVDCSGEAANVMTIGVAPAEQGSGLGRRLLDWIIDEATDSGAETLLLEVRSDNNRARNIYESSGFEHIQTWRRYYQPGDIDAHIMWIHLTVKAS